MATIWKIVWKVLEPLERSVNNNILGVNILFLRRTNPIIIERLIVQRCSSQTTLSLRKKTQTRTITFQLDDIMFLSDENGDLDKFVI